MTTRLSPQRVGLPPPLPLDLDLIAGEHTVGWITGDAIGFLGFADHTEAVHAAWVAYRVLSRRLARTHGTRPVPIDTASLAVQRRGGADIVLADGRAIATLVRPAAGSASGPDSFGFEIPLPPPVDEIHARAMALLMYRALRKSGLRWALWSRTRARSAAPTSTLTKEEDHDPTSVASRHRHAAAA